MSVGKLGSLNSGLRISWKTKRVGVLVVQLLGRTDCLGCIPGLGERPLDGRPSVTRLVDRPDGIRRGLTVASNDSLAWHVATGPYNDAPMINLRRAASEAAESMAGQLARVGRPGDFTR